MIHVLKKAYVELLILLELTRHFLIPYLKISHLKQAEKMNWLRSAWNWV